MDKMVDWCYDVVCWFYILGKLIILDFNVVIVEKDIVWRNYIIVLKIYWSLYYGIRSMMGYDFFRKVEILCIIFKF